MKKKGTFIATLTITVLLLTGCLVPAFIGATSSRSALCVVETVAVDLFFSGGTAHVPPEKTDKKIEERRQKNASYSVPSACKTLYSCRVEKYEGFEVCYFGKETEEKIIYFHGGSFMWQPLVFHFAFCSNLAKETSMQVIMPIYPKAPEYTYTDVLDWIYSFYGTVAGVKAFIGDSAGGGLLLSFAQYLTDKGQPSPANLIALSPLFDASLSNPQIADYAPLDPMLNRDDLARKLLSYVGDGDISSPYVSPIYCDYSALGEVTVITGTHEILYPDAELWNKNLTAENIKHNFYPYENQIHTFAIYPMPERILITALIKKILTA